MTAEFTDALLLCMQAARGFAFTFEKNPDRADDLTQETLIRAWSSRASFAQNGNMKAWLFTIMRNVYISQRRKTMREVEDANGTIAAAVPSEGGQEDHLAMQELREALALLPDSQREALIMVGAAGLSYEEASQVTGASVSALKARVSRGRTKLAELLGEEAPEGVSATIHPIKG